MSFLSRAIENAEKAKQSPNHNFKIGDKVKIFGDDYYGITGTVVRFSENTIGLPLVHVKTDRNRDSYSPCFYPHELEKSL